MRKGERKKQPIGRKTAVSILISILIPTIFIFVMLIIFKLIWVLPFLLLGIIITAGIANRKRPDFFAALRKPRNEANLSIGLNPQFKPSSSARRSYMMLVRISRASGEQITINCSPFVIGRAPASDYCISDGFVSNRHLVIEYNADKKLCFATDVSTNGSYLNGVRMQNNICRPLQQGDTLQIAGLMFRVEYMHF